MESINNTITSRPYPTEQILNLVAKNLIYIRFMK